MSIPENICLNNIQASIFGFLNKTRPHLRPPHRNNHQNKAPANTKRRKQEQPTIHISSKERWSYLWGASWVVDGPGDENAPLPIYDYGSVVIRNRAAHHAHPWTQDQNTPQKLHKSSPRPQHGLVMTLVIDSGSSFSLTDMAWSGAPLFLLRCYNDNIYS